MPLPERGSIEWFTRQKRLILQYIRALDIFESAYRAAELLRKGWETIDAEMKSAILCQLCISYGRPFAQSPSFPHRFMKQNDQFDADIHKHIIELRNKLIAHSDEEYADATMHIAHVEVMRTMSDVVVTTCVARSDYCIEDNKVASVSRAVLRTYERRIDRSIQCVREPFEGESFSCA